MMMCASCKGDVQVWHFKEKLCVGFYHWIFLFGFSWQEVGFFYLMQNIVAFYFLSLRIKHTRL